MKAEIQDLQEAHINERQEMEQIQNELTRDLKLKYEVCISMLAWHKSLVKTVMCHTSAQIR